MIDAVELEQEISWFRATWVEDERNPDTNAEVRRAFCSIADAADAYLATLPKMRVIEVERWGIVYPSGHPSCLLYSSESEAASAAGIDPKVPGTPIRLTGKARVPA